ncbi:MAG: aspartate/glutamate racemase family protein [Burkholderiaceae bacterium]
MTQTLLGVLTPSSNTVLEPVTSAIVSELPNTSAHFGRFEVTEISNAPSSQAQFTIDKQLAAAHLLAHARVGSIVWSGTAASWLGFDKDEHLCAEITRATGIAAGSSVLAVNELFARHEVKRFGLVTPYIDEIQEAIIQNYAASGFECIAERHMGEHRNFEFAQFSEERVAGLIREVAASKPDAITVMCTNMRGATQAAALEEELGIPIIDSTSAAVWTGLRLAGGDPAQVTGWGRLFGNP